MRTVGLSLCMLASGACASLHRSTSPVYYGSPAAALDCAENVLERSGFQVQGDAVGARLDSSLMPGRHDTTLVARQNNGVTSETGYVRVNATPIDSSRYLLRATGVTTRADGTKTSSLLHEQGVNAVLSKCGAVRLPGS